MNSKAFDNGVMILEYQAKRLGYAPTIRFLITGPDCPFALFCNCSSVQYQL